MNFANMSLLKKVGNCCHKQKMQRTKRIPAYILFFISYAQFQLLFFCTSTQQFLQCYSAADILDFDPYRLLLN